ncbi:MAG TPA: anthranilate synthase component I, partial [Actinobacteria bacterium]|nr:anthranilate synthase component I [Actinomycetota bacterium]
PVVPLTTTILADRETPVSAFEKLVGSAPGFLLESVQGGEQWAQWSFLGWDPEFTVVSRGGLVSAEGADLDLPDGDPLEVLEELLARYRSPDLPCLPPLHSGLVGYLSYDVVRYIERMPNMPLDDRDLPEMVWQFVGSLAAVDRFSQSIVLVRNVFVADDPSAQYDAAVRALSSAAERLGAGTQYTPTQLPSRIPPEITPISTLDRKAFESGVEAVREYVRKGDAFQVTLSQRLETDYGGDAFRVYRALRLINPSPFMFFLRHPQVTVVGSSPELMTRVRDGIVHSRPIAGTRPRGKTQDEDQALEEDLLADPKERAEHVMLVDLARNDLGRVCEFGTVDVDELMVIERFSHVMHIVSGVSGKLRPGLGPVDVLRAVFPHGTVSGAPKVAAMQIIDELEPVARGPYAGALGYLDFSGNVDTAICLRTVVIADGKAWVQAGAGLVADSDPATEYDETMAKAAAALAAIKGASDV